MDAEKLRRFEMWKAGGVPENPDKPPIPGSMLEKRSPSPLFPLDQDAGRISYNYFMGRVANSNGKYPDFYTSYIEFQSLTHENPKTKIFLSDLSFLRSAMQKKENQYWNDDYYCLGVSFIHKILKIEAKAKGIELPKINDQDLREYFFSLFGKQGTLEMAEFKLIVDRLDAVNLPEATRRAIEGNVSLPGFTQSVKNFKEVKNRRSNEFKRKEFEFGLKHLAPLKESFGKNWDSFEEGVLDMYGLYATHFSLAESEGVQETARPVDLSFLPEIVDPEAKKREKTFSEQERLSSFLDSMALVRQLNLKDTFKVSSYENGAYYALRHFKKMADGEFPVFETPDLEAYFGDLIDADNHQQQIQFLKEKIEPQFEDKDNPDMFVVLFQRGVRDINFTQLLNSFVENSKAIMKSIPRHVKDEYHAKTQGVLGTEGQESFLMGFMDVREVYNRWQQNQKLSQFREAAVTS